MRRSSSSLSFLLLGFALLILLAACSRPLRSDSFRLSDGSGIYTFALDMSDSLCTYSLSFYASLDKGRAPQGFPIKVYLHSPSGATYCESLYYDASSELLVPYRRGLRRRGLRAWGSFATGPTSLRIFNSAFLWVTIN